MAYCRKCGNMIPDTSTYCIYCGNPTSSNTQVKPNQQGLETAIKIMFFVSYILNIGAMFIAVVSLCLIILGLTLYVILPFGLVFLLVLIPLAWMIPMHVYCVTKLNNREPIGLGFKICTLILINVVLGILLICHNDD